MKLKDYLKTTTDEILSSMDKHKDDQFITRFFEGELRAITNLKEALNHNIFDDVYSNGYHKEANYVEEPKS